MAEMVREAEMDASRRQRITIDAASTPKLQRFASLRHDAARDRWMILAPERVFTPNAAAIAVLNLCDGTRTVEEIARTLATTYRASEERIRGDVIALLQQLADKGVLSA
jgi:pyrroloquinoline quinone biosynthesis protein D